VKGLFVHFGLLAVSGVMALSTWLRDEEAETPKAQEVEVWGGKPESVESVSYESNTRKVRLEPKKDQLGPWYVARFEKTEETPAGHPPGHPPVDGAPPPAPASSKRTSETFVAVKEAEELVRKLAPMMAVRSIGKAETGKAADFGLDKPEGTLKVKIAGKEHVLTIGGQTPGGAERYAKYGTSGELFAISNELTQSLSYADSRLMERELHGFKPEEVDKIRLSRAGKTRELVRVTGKQDAWADSTAPSKADETAGNWLSKLERVRVSQYVEKPSTPLRPEDLVIRVDYFAGSRNLGFLELHKIAAEKTPEYLARTEYVRWYTKVVASAAEQVDRDVAALFK
jgi:hypothetical protein